jgi:predicted ATPase
VRPVEQGKVRIVFQDRWEPAIWYEPSQVSQGTLVLLAFLVLAHSDQAPDIIGIEDPEHALHPYLVRQVIGMLRDLAHGRLGPKAVQVVLATHSAQLLNFLEPKEVRFLSRSLEDGSTVVREAPADSDNWKAAYEEYDESLGEMWLSGSLGGVPGTPPTQ